jgi:hypothetical protein
MNLLQRYSCNVTISGLCLAAVTGAYAQVSSIDSAVIVPRVFNNIPGATFTGVNTFVNPNIGVISLSEAGVSAPTGFANRDIWQFANGASAYNFQNNDYFSASLNLTLTDTADSPRKEAGFLFSDPSGSFGGDVQLFVDSDGHEVVQIGGISFYAFAPTHVPPYTTGQTINLGMSYTVNPGTGNNAFQFSANGVYSPYFDFATGQGIGNEPGSTPNTLGGYFQIQNDPANQSNGGTALFGDISITSVPEPSTLAFLGLGIVSLLFRRRRI